MKCSLAGCPGEYEERSITHTVRVRGQVIVIDHVPAKVCDVCGDTLLSLETVRRLEALLQADLPPAKTVPLYEYAAVPSA
jgi:HTH-type transcriptional regulator/antitoxin MqsA